MEGARLMRVMTFNLRFENDADGENRWVCRRDMVARVVARYGPWVLGTQEGMVSQLRFLEEHLQGYELYAPGRFWDESCQYPTLFYRRDVMRPLEGDEFWLSLTPRVHRSKSWDSAFPRMISFGRFESLEDGRAVWVGVTHLDHIGDAARAAQAERVAEWACGRDGSCILMGDFNDVPGSPAHRLLIDVLQDCWEALGRSEDESGMTYHKFSGIPQIARMDWILASRDMRVLDQVVVRDQEGGRYPSDHFPCFADVKWA
ncbi:MAG TPA: endonuclease/exonuclease/phosphatase family protein [Syntrophobacter fumaroxidans]|mgnify:CR=1 FL=1|nr:endonuclease/exonuclease/phosphatase family protein [Syntrophobacter fumaroxidans]